MSVLQRESWGPYAVGAGIGLLEVFAMATAKHPLGVSTVFEKLAAGLTKAVAPSAADRFVEAGGEEPELDWETALVGGILGGSALSAALSGKPVPRRLPPIWRAEKGTNTESRYGTALAGGALMIFGARMAKGCTSGHGISGAMQLAASSWTFNPIMFAAGAAAAYGIFGRKR
jgi:uncharacterized membrane protein YedE/YeeE